MTDEPNETRDRELARHILDVHELGEILTRSKMHPKIIKPEIDPELLRKYIAYARKNVFPVLTEEAKRKIEEFYISLRSKAKENSPMPITARQLESIIRLAEASARVRLSDRVEVEDVERAINLIRKSLEQIAIEPETGEIDIDYAFSGTSKRQRDRIIIIKKIIERLEPNYEKGVPEEEILNEAEKEGISRNKAKEILSKLKQMGEVYSPKYDHYKLVTKV